MFKQKLKADGHGCKINIHAERPAYVKPEIIETYFDADGVRMYETKDNRHFIADVVDRIFNPVKTAIRHRKYKGKNPDTTALFLSI